MVCLYANGFNLSPITMFSRRGFWIYIYQILRGIENTGLVLEKFVLGHASRMNSQAALASTVNKLKNNEMK